MSEERTRYHLFGYDTYYPGGGMGDYYGSFDSTEEAAEHIRSVSHRDSWHLAVVNGQGNLEETPHWWSDFATGWRQ